MPATGVWPWKSTDRRPASASASIGTLDLTAPSLSTNSQHWFSRNRQKPVRPADVRAAESNASKLDDAVLQKIAIDCRERVAKSGLKPGEAATWCGLIAESIYRVHGFRLHDCQIQAMLVGAGGMVLEMQTGEGKTVVTGAIAALQSLTNPSVHVSTTNDYLAERDLKDMRCVFELLGLSARLLPTETNEDRSRQAYRSNIAYGPGYQFGFDYLRDQMYLRRDRPSKLGRGIVHRIRQSDPFSIMIQPDEFHVALVDEADSVMIDEALTPLIISLPTQGNQDPRAYKIAKRVTDRFQKTVDYHVELPRNAVNVTDAGNMRALDAIADERSLSLSRPWRVYIMNALRARYQFSRNIDYVVINGEVQLVDRNTGRIQPDRRWQDGLHQAIEAKEGVKIQAGRESTAQITRQRFLQRYSRMIGLTGTAMSAATEFQETYGCRVRPIATNRPCVRQKLPTRFFASLQAKLESIADDVAKRHAAGQPVLVGTKTVKESFEVRDALQSRGLAHVVLNGVQDEAEAEIIAAAGLAGGITIATNMAGRGTDIKPDQAALDAGGLHVVGVSVNNSPRIDRQLAGRSARQGQPGSCQFFVAADDSILVENESSLCQTIRRGAKSNGESRSYASALSKLQQRLEAKHHRQRQAMMNRDRWMDTVRESIEKA